MRIKEIRKQKNLKQEDVAKILEIDRSQLSRIESKKAFLNNEQIVKLCVALDISADYFLELIDEPKKNKEF